MSRISRRSPTGCCRHNGKLVAAAATWAVSVIGLSGRAWADDLEDFNFAGVSGTATPATYTPTAYNSTDLDVASALSRGANAAASAGTNSFRSVGFKNDGIATTNTDYFEFSLSSVAGQALSLTSLVANYNGTASYQASTGVSTQYAYSFNDSAFTLIGSPTAVFYNTSTPTTYSLSSVAALQNIPDNQTVYFRVYATGQTATGSFGYFSNTSSGANDGLMVNGSVSTEATAPMNVASGMLTYDPTATGGGTASTTFANGGPANFIDSGLGTDVSFTNGNFVTFSDLAVNASGGSATVRVDAAGVTPTTVNVTNTVGTYTFTGGAINGSGGITKSGAGTLVLQNSSTYSGGTTVNGGTVSIAADGVLGTGGITLNGGTLQTTGPITESAGTTAAGAPVRTITIGTSGTIDLNGQSDVFGGKLSGGGTLALTSTGSGTGASLTFLSQASGTTGPVTIGSGTSLSLLPPSGASSAFIGVGSGTATSVFTGNLYLGLTAAQAAGGTATASVVDLEETGNTTLAGTGSVYLAPGGTIDVYSTATTALTFNENAPVVLVTDGSTGHSLAATRLNTLSFGNAIGGTSAGITVGAAPVTTGTATITVSNASLIGKVILNGASTYTAATTVAGGTFVVNSTLASSGVTVGASTTLTVTAAPTSVTFTPTLAGTGTLAGTVALSGAITGGSGATATDTIGRLTTGVETWNSGSSYVVKLGSTAAATTGANGDAGTAGVVNDELIIAGLSPSTSGLTVSPIALAGLAAGQYSFLIADDTTNSTAFNSMLNSTLVASTANLPSGSTATLADGSDGGSGEDLFLNVTIAAPEPTSLLLAGVVAAPLVLGRRRRGDAV